MQIPIPANLSLPKDADSKPFELTGKFIVMNNMLTPLMLNGEKVMLDDEEGDEGDMSEENMQHEASESEDYESGEQDEEYQNNAEMKHDENCSCKECAGKNKGQSFMLAIEGALAKKKK